MVNTKRLWYVFGTIGLLSTLVLCVGFLFGIRDVLGTHDEIRSIIQVEKPQTEAVKIGTGEQIRIVAYGDSLTKGTGDETLKGYIGALEDIMKQRGQNVRVSNFGINGYTSTQLLADFTEHRTAQEMVAKADVLLLTIGGNDLYRPSKDVAATPEDFKKRSGPALERIAQLFKEIRKANPNTILVYVGLYNPFRYTQAGTAFDPFVQEWNTKIQALLMNDQQAIFVPSADLFQRNTKLYLSQDLYHPNAKGYQRMAQRIAQVLE
jgi:lysophospholipase L1-like esterase